MSHRAAGLVVVGLLATGCNRPDVVGVIELRQNRLAVILAVSERKPVHAEGRCVADDDGETRRLARQGPDTLLDLPVAGLRDDTPWTCTVAVDDGKRTREYEVVVELSGVPEEVGGYLVEGQTDGYTLVTEWEHAQLHPNVRTVLLDPEGRARWYRFTDHPVISGLDSTLAPSGHVLTGGGPDQPPTWYNSLGDLVHQAGEPPVPGPYHHHAEPVDGGVLTLTNLPNTRPAGDGFMGFSVLLLDGNGAVAWTWDSQLAVDAGTLVPSANHDGFHANSVSLVDDSWGPAAWVSLYATRQIARIDRITGEVTHVLGATGTMALLSPTGATLNPSDWFDGQHDPELAWPRMLLLDNGLTARRSRVIELELDLDANTATQTWSWEQPGWFEPIFGDADRLAPDRVLVSRGRCWDNCGVDGLPEDRVTDVVEVNADGTIPWRLIGPDPSRGIYRAERVDICWLWDDPDRC